MYIIFTIFTHTSRSICSARSQLKVKMATQVAPPPRAEFKNGLKRTWLNIALSEVYMLVTNVRLSSLILIAKH